MIVRGHRRAALGAPAAAAGRRAARSGSGRAGSFAANSSGEYVISFSTAQTVPHRVDRDRDEFSFLRDDSVALRNLFEAAGDVVQESVLNSLCSADAMEGRDGNRAEAFPVRAAGADGLRERPQKRRRAPLGTPRLTHGRRVRAPSRLMSSRSRPQTPSRTRTCRRRCAGCRSCRTARRTLRASVVALGIALLGRVLELGRVLARPARRPRPPSALALLETHLPKALRLFRWSPYCSRERVGSAARSALHSLAAFLCAGLLLLRLLDGGLAHAGAKLRNCVRNASRVASVLAAKRLALAFAARLSRRLDSAWRWLPPAERGPGPVQWIR